MSTPITRSAFSALNSNDFVEVVVEEGQARDLEYTAFLNVSQMERNPEKFYQVTGLPTMGDKPEGTRFTSLEHLPGGQTERTAYPRGAALEFTWEGWRDENYGVHRRQSANLRRSSDDRLERDGHAVLNNAFDTAYAGFTSGESLLSTSHARVTGAAGSAWANRPSVDIGFSQTYLQGALIRFHNLSNEQGIPLVLHPSLVIIGPSNIFTAREILGSSGAPYSSDNEINSLVQEDLRWMVSHYLAVSTYHFLMAAQGVHDLQMGIRDAPMFDSFDDPWTKNAVFTGYQRNTQSFFNSPLGVDGSK